MFAVGVSQGFSLLTSSCFRGVGPLCDYITGRREKNMLVSYFLPLLRRQLGFHLPPSTSRESKGKCNMLTHHPIHSRQRMVANRSKCHGGFAYHCACALVKHGNPINQIH